jgi:hypothetical protein
MDPPPKNTPPKVTRSRVTRPEFRKAVWHKEDGNSGPRGGVKAPNQLLVKAEYGGQVMELSLVDATLQSFGWQALKSKVRVIIV